MRLRWTRPALAHIVEIYTYIRKDNPAAARRVVDRIRRDAKHLCMHPQFGRKGRIEGTRELVISRYPYIIVYRTVDEAIEYLPSSMTPATGRNPCLQPE